MSLIMDELEIENERGFADCEADIERNSVRFFWQTRSAWGDYMTELFAMRFAVAVTHVSDITTTAQSSYRGGYNSCLLYTSDAADE